MSELETVSSYNSETDSDSSIENVPPTKKTKLQRKRLEYFKGEEHENLSLAENFIKEESKF